MATENEELDEIQKMKRIKLIAPELYQEIAEMEAKIYQELNDQMMDIALVKNLILEYNNKEARKMFNNLVKRAEIKNRVKKTDLKR